MTGIERLDFTGGEGEDRVNATEFNVGNLQGQGGNDTLIRSEGSTFVAG